MENKRRMGEILVEKGKLKIGDIDKALICQKDNEKPLGEILVDRGLIDYSDVLEVLKEQGWEYKSTETVLTIEDQFRSLEDFWIERLIIPLSIKDNIMNIIAYNPVDNDSLRRIRKEYKVNGIKIYVENKVKLEKKLCDLFGFCFTIKARENLTEKYEEDGNIYNKGVFYISEQDITEDIKGVILEKLKEGNKILLENDTVEGIYKLTVL